MQKEIETPTDEDWFRVVFDGSADAIFFLTTDGRIVQANRTACDRLGYTQRELTGMTAVDLNAPETRVVVRRNLDELNKRGKTLSEVIHVAKDGQRIPTEVHSRVVRLEGQEFVLTIARDISLRRQAEGRLRQLQRQFQLLFEGSRTSNSFFDLGGKLVICNHYCARLIGKGSPEEIVGKDVEELFAQPQGSQFRERMKRVAAGGKPETHTTEFDFASTGRIWLQTSYNPLVDEQGTVVGIQVISQDVTEHHLFQEKLRQAEKLDTVGILAGGIAHDFNNLLAGLQGNLELLQLSLNERRWEDAEAKLESALGVFTRAKALTKQLLTFSKGGAPVIGPCDLGPLLPEWAEFALSGSGLLLETDIAQDLWICECDAQQIGQVVDNLVINARQASPGNRAVRLRAENVTLDKPYVRIAVTDEGPGIPQEILVKVFEPFFTTRTEGSGLGLATCRSIVQRHGGRIEIDTKPGQGATFYVFLPASPNLRIVPRRESPVEWRGTGAVLVMDDDDSVRETLTEMLEHSGFEVFPTRNGSEALDAFRNVEAQRREFLLILLDLTVPGGMGGLETAARLRRLGARTPIVSMSGYAEVPESRRDGETQGHLTKPFTRQELADLLLRIVPARLDSRTVQPRI